MALTYTYDNGRISQYALKRVDTSCHRNENRTVLIGVFCKQCPFYAGIQDDYVICEHYKEDDPGASKTRSKINDRLKYLALCSYYD